MTTTPAIRLRPMGAQDVEEVAALHTRLDPSPYSESQWVKELLSPYARSMVMERGGEVLGFGLVWLVGQDASLHTMGIAPSLQGKGYGAMLLSAILGWAFRQRATRLTLEVRAGNEAAISLYRRYGFLPQGKRPGYYQDGEDALVMTTPPFLKPDYRERLWSLQHALDQKLGHEARHPWASVFDTGAPPRPLT